MAEASPTEQLRAALEVRTSRLTPHITRAEFSSFQEYFYTAIKENGELRISENLRFSEGKGRSDPETDFVRIPGSQGFTAVELIHAFEDYFHLPPRRDRNAPSMSYGDLYCIYGEQNGKFIFQGAGVIHRDSSGRQNDSSFKLVFDSQEPLKEFVQWMEESPGGALNAVTKEVHPAVSERVYTPRRWIGELTIANVNTGEVKAKAFERPVLDQDIINVVEKQIKRWGSIDAVKEYYQRVEEEEPRFQENARAMVLSIDAYKKEFLSKPPS